MKYYALLGEKLSHSYSKIIHEYLFQKYNLEAEYSLWEVSPDQFSNIFTMAREKKLSGFNITIPYKESFLSQVTSLEESAKKIGAINTVYLEEDSRAYNTDCTGFQKMLEYFQVEVKGKKAVILGTGGAAKAVAEALRRMNIHSLVLISRNPREKNQLSYQEIPEADFIINTTPLGMYPNTERSPLPKAEFSKFKIAIDVIYNPLETKFLKDAKESNLITINGLFMLVAQAIESQAIWLHKTFDKDVYYEVYKYLEGIIYENYGNQRS